MAYNISQFEKRKGLGMTGKQRKRHPENVCMRGLSVQFFCIQLRSMRLHESLGFTPYRVEYEKLL